MTSEDLKFYGKSLFGESWQSQLASDLNVDRRKVNDWLKERRQLPLFLNDEIPNLLAKKKNEIEVAITHLDNYWFAVKKAIDQFRINHLHKATIGSTIYYKLEYNDHLLNDFKRENYTAYITFESPIENENGWYKHTFEEAYFMIDITRFHELMVKKITKDKAVSD